MKRFICMGLLWWGLSVSAQEDSAWSVLLQPVNEISLNDSLRIDTISPQVEPMDSMAVKKWFGRLLGTTKNSRLKNRNYFLVGKITALSNFDLLVLLEEKKRQDSNSVQVVHLISAKKDGTYIASIEAAVGGSKKSSSYNISSWLYKDLKIVLDSKIITNDKLYEDMMSYRISNGGRFILTEND